MVTKDLNEHVGEGNRGDKEVMGRFGVKEKNQEEQMMDFVKRMDITVVSTYFQKREGSVGFYVKKKASQSRSVSHFGPCLINL